MGETDLRQGHPEVRGSFRHALGWQNLGCQKWWAELLPGKPAADSLGATSQELWATLKGITACTFWPSWLSRLPLELSHNSQGCNTQHRKARASTDAHRLGPLQDPALRMTAGPNFNKKSSGPAYPNYPLRHPKYHLIETIRPLMKGLGTIPGIDLQPYRVGLYKVLTEHGTV